MTKREMLLVGSLILLVALIMLIWEFFSRYQIVPVMPDTSASSTVTSIANDVIKASTPTTGTKTQTFKSLLAADLSRECTYTTVGSTQSHALVDIANGKLYGEFRSTDQSGTDHNNLFVYDGRYLYTWQEGKTAGTKTTLTSLSQLPLTLPPELSGGASYGTSDKSVSWDCHPWIPVPSKLVPPSYVSF